MASPLKSEEAFRRRSVDREHDLIFRSLQQIADDTAITLKQAREKVRQFGEAIKASKTPADLRQSASKWLLAEFARPSLRPLPAVPTRRRDGNEDFPSDAILAGFLDNPDQAVQDFIHGRGGIAGHDVVPEVGRIAWQAIKQKMLIRPTRMIRAVKSGDVVKPEDQHEYRAFFQTTVLPALKEKFSERFAPSAQGPWHEAEERLIAFNLLKDLVGIHDDSETPDNNSVIPADKSWLTPGEQTTQLALGSETPTRRLQVARNVRAWAKENGLQLRSRKGRGRAEEVNADDWEKVARAWRAGGRSKAGGRTPTKRADHSKQTSTIKQLANERKPLPPAGEIAMGCTGCRDVQCLSLSPSAERTANGLWTETKFCKVCNAGKQFIQCV